MFCSSQNKQGSHHWLASDGLAVFHTKLHPLSAKIAILSYQTGAKHDQPINSRTNDQNHAASCGPGSLSQYVRSLRDTARNSSEAKWNFEEIVLSVEPGFALILHGRSRAQECAFISPVRLNSIDHTKQYPTYRMFEAGGVHGIDAPLGRSIRSLKGVN